MPYARKSGQTKKLYKPRKNNNSSRYKKTNRDFKFNQINTYKVKPQPFPRVLNTRMVFSDSRTLPFSLGLSNSWTYRANSIWDPDYTGGGRTVAGHNVMQTLYGRYLVTGVKIQLSFLNPGVDGARVGIRLRVGDSSTALGQDMRQIIEAPLTYVSGLANTGSQKKNFNLFVRPWSLIGISKLEYMANSSAYSSVINQNPQIPGFTAAGGTGCTFDVFAINPNVATVDSIDYTIKLTFYVQLYNRLNVTSTGI